MFSKHMFNFDGHDISEYGCFVCETPIFPTPERRVNKIEIPGRDGYLTEDEGTYENISVTYDVILLASEVYPYSIETALHKIRAWLITDMSFKKLRDDNHAGGFYWARCDGLNDFEYVNDKAVRFSITFDCEPFFYHDEGTIQQDVPAGQPRFTNIGNYFSEPTFYVYEATQNFAMNGFRFSHPTALSTNIIIDSKAKIVTDISGTEDVSVYATGKYPTLKVDSPVIAWSGADTLRMIPNWRSI